MKNILFFVTVCAVVFSACKPKANTPNAEETASAEKEASTEIPATPTKQIKTEQTLKEKYGEGLYAQFHITEGDVLIKLEMERAPLTTANFVALAEGKMPNKAKEVGTPFYDGLTFHRVISNANGDGQQFMIQGGDPDGNGTGGPGYQFRDEFHPELSHTNPGVLSMANSGKATNGSQFFITLAPTPHLDNGHSIFGKVVEGLDVANRTLQGDKIRWIAIIRVGDAAKDFDALETFNKLKNGNPNS